MIGKTVTVTIDRPLGSFHPKYHDLQYPINYGYVKGVMGGDGQWQDAYVLGVDQPISQFVGKIIAIIHRFDDVEEKWVVAPHQMTFTKEQILKQVHFQEKYFKIEILM